MIFEYFLYVKSLAIQFYMYCLIISYYRSLDVGNSGQERLSNFSRSHTQSGFILFLRQGKDVYRRRQGDYKEDEFTEKWACFILTLIFKPTFFHLDSSAHFLISLHCPLILLVPYLFFLHLCLLWYLYSSPVC